MIRYLYIAAVVTVQTYGWPDVYLRHRRIKATNKADALDIGRAWATNKLNAGTRERIETETVVRLGFA